MDDLTALHAYLRSLMPDLDGPEAAALAERAATDAALLALDAIDDRAGCPPRIIALAIAATYHAPEDPDIAYQITAIQPSGHTTTQPAHPVADRIGWHTRRLTRTLRPTDPAPVTVHQQGWALRCTGNAVALESRLRALGATSAVAIAPHTVWLAGEAE